MRAIIAIFCLLCNFTLRAAVYLQPLLSNSGNSVTQQILVNNSFSKGNLDNNLILNFYYLSKEDTVGVFQEKIKSINVVDKYYYTFNTHNLNMPANKCIVSWLDDNGYEAGTKEQILVWPDGKTILTPLQLYTLKNKAEQITPDLYFDETDKYMVIKSSLLNFLPGDKEIKYELAILKNNKKNSLVKSMVQVKKINENKNYNLEITEEIDSLQTGNYLVRLRVFDSLKVKLSSEIFFQKGNTEAIDTLQSVYKEAEPKALVIDTKNLGITFVSNYDRNTLKRNLAALDPIASPLESAVIENINTSQNDTLLKNFFYNFWLERDAKNPEGAWKEYGIKLNYIAKKYGGGGMLGYKTDRGRVYLRYGIPTKTEMVNYEKNARPYEVWQYDNIEGNSNAVFLFVNFNTYGSNLRLLHSNVPGEVFNQNWEMILLQDQALEHRIYDFLRPGSKR